MPPASERKKAYDKAYQEIHRERLAELNRNRRLVRQFGITAGEYDEMVYLQGGRCAICQEPQTRNMSIDHDHGCCDSRESCGFCVRALLCSRCNSMIGMARDKQSVLANAINYLNKYERI